MHELWPNIVNQKWVLGVVLFNTLIKIYEDRPLVFIVFYYTFYCFLLLSTSVHYL